MQQFISDLHLSPERPETANAFLQYLQGPARSAKTLWILGDLFEYWAGDDDLAAPFHTEMVDAISALSASGTAIRVIVGNRDFLLGSHFAEKSKAELVAEPVCIDLHGVPTVLLHGDALCTDDLPYQQFRAMVRNPAWQAQFLAQPLAVRHKIAADLRAKSEKGKQETSAEIMDVNDSAVAACLVTHNAVRMIHGHTHRPACHRNTIGGIDRERWVLADWHGQATWLEASEKGIEARTR